MDAGEMDRIEEEYQRELDLIEIWGKVSVRLTASEFGQNPW